jgi:molybdopterin molybdotransferase
LSSPLAQDCFAFPGKRIAVEQALQLLRDRTGTVVTDETVPLDSTLGRILAAPVEAARDVPAFDNAAVDGYAFAWTAAMAEAAVTVPLAPGRAAAGHPFPRPLAAGHGLRVLTGAPMPKGSDTVALQEASSVAGDRVTLPAGLKRGSNRRRAGEDMRKGQVVLGPGTRLAPQHIGVLAELGLARVRVFARLRVALLSSGDELQEPGKPLGAGGVYDANRHILRPLLALLPVELTDLGIMPDDAPAVRARLEAAAHDHDVILTSGGASRGDEDHVVRSVGELGRLDFWQIAMKPGRPLAFGRINNAAFIGLPGNPVATMVCFLRFARPVLLQLAGAGWREPRAFPVRAGFAMSKQAGRTELVRARLSPDPTTGWTAHKILRQGSGVLTTMVEADGLVELPAETTTVQVGDFVPFLSFPELGAAA